MTVSTLLPCPFCGGAPRMLHGGPGNWFVQCVDCKAASNDVGEEHAYTLWNARANDLKQLHREVITLRLQVATVEARQASTARDKARRALARIRAQQQQLTDGAAERVQAQDPDQQE